MNTHEHIMAGVGTIASIQLIDQIPVTPDMIMLILKAAGQIAVAVFTIVGIVKSWKKKE